MATRDGESLLAEAQLGQDLPGCWRRERRRESDRAREMTRGAVIQARCGRYRLSMHCWWTREYVECRDCLATDLELRP